MHGLATKRTEKRVKNANVNDFETDNQASTGRVTYYFTYFVDFLSVTPEWIEFGCVHKLCPLSRLVRTVPAVHKLVTETRLIVCQYTVRVHVRRTSTIGHHSNS